MAKYWGKRDAEYNLPAVGSLSIGLDALATETGVHFDATLDDDRIELNGRSDPDQARRVSDFLDLVREHAGIAARASVVSENTFPTGAGLASSASGFAALALAATEAAGLTLSTSELSALARRGSGSAARSVVGGFAYMHRGRRADGADAYAEQLAPPEHWPLSAVIAVTDTATKAVGSTAGMQRSARTSPFYEAWVASADDDLKTMTEAVMARDFERLAEVAEHSSFKMHGLMLSARPALVYWNETTVAAVHAVRELQREGIGVFTTIDAGPQVKAICEPDAMSHVAERLRAVPGVRAVLESGVAGPARLIESTAP